MYVAHLGDTHIRIIDYDFTIYNSTRDCYELISARLEGISRHQRKIRFLITIICILWYTYKIPSAICWHY
jgi:hypothetical protein